MSVTASPLLPTVILLASGIMGLITSSFLKISPIIGFFIIGGFIGPEGMGFVEDDSHTIYFLGEIGVCFLLFDVGLHLSLKELRRTWQKFISIGLLQTTFTTLILSTLVYFSGFEFKIAITLGLILSLSSTALVLKMLADENDEGSPVGQRATEVLVFQDIIAILLMVLFAAELENGISISILLFPILKMLIFATFVILLAKFALKPIFKLLISIKNDEVFTASALLIVFLSSWVTESLGLSLALGAFLGGLALSESTYAYLVRSEVAPFRSLLLSLFFLSVGINFDIHNIWSNGYILVTALFGFVSAKIIGNYLAFRLLGIERANSTLLSCLLGQGSEFAFVLLTTAAATGLISSEIASFCSTIVGLSLLGSPIFAMFGCKFSRSICQVKNEEEAEVGNEKEVIIVRIDEFGRQLAMLLESENIPYRAHDFDHERLAYAQSRGFNVFYSDINRPRTLGRVSLGKVLAVVCLVEDDMIIQALIKGLNKVDHELPILAATDNPTRLENLYKLGVQESYIKQDNSLIALFESLLVHLGFEEQDIQNRIIKARKIIFNTELFPRTSNTLIEEYQALAA